MYNSVPTGDPHPTLSDNENEDEEGGRLSTPYREDEERP